MIRLRLLGETAIDVDGTPVGPESQVLFAALLVLALERGKRIARGAFHRLLWPDADEDSGRHNLRQVAYKLRQLGAPIDSTQSSLMLPSASVGGELVELLAGDLAVGTRLLGGARVGELMPGYAPTFSPPFADWVDEQRGLLHGQLRRALLASLSASRTVGRWREVEAVAREVMRFDALNEEATLALAEATALAGAKAQALGIIDRYIDEVGRRSPDMTVPATVLRRRIAERMPVHRYVTVADRCFVGRAAEMAELLPHWYSAKEGRGCGVLLWGEPGIGKTRLAHEVSLVATLQGARVVRAASRAWDTARPLGAIVDLVTPIRALPGAAGVDPRCNAYLDRLTRHDPDRPLTELPDPATLHRRVQQAVFDLVDAVQSETPLMLVLDDVQWLDPASWEVLAELMRKAKQQRLFVVMTSRELEPGQMPSSDAWEVLYRRQVTGIDASATNELLDTMTREAGRYMDPEHRGWCVPLAGGNPLFVQEVGLQWIEKGSVREAPATIRAMIEDRIQRLSSLALRALHVTALTPEGATAGLVARTLEASPAETLDALEMLGRSGLTVDQNGILRLRHEAIADSILGRSQPSSTVLLHERIASALGELGETTRDPALLWRGYQHWTAAGVQSRALEALDAFANHLFGNGRVEDGLTLLETTRIEGMSSEMQSRLNSTLLRAYAHLGRWSHALSLAQQLEPDLSRRGELLLAAYEARWRAHEDLLLLSNEAGQVARAVTLAPDIRVRAATWSEIFADNRGSCADDSEIHDSIAPLLSYPGTSRAYALHYEVIRHCRRRQYADAIQAAVDLRTLAETISDAADSTRLLRHAAVTLSICGHTDVAIEVLMSAQARCEATQALSSLALCQLALAEAYIYCHDLSTAEAWLHRSKATCERLDDSFSTPGLSTVGLQLAAIRSNAPEAQQLLEAIGQPQPGDGNLTRLALQLSAKLRTAVLTNSSISDVAALSEATQQVLARHRTIQMGDFVAASITYGLQYAGDMAAARSFFDQYVSSMRLRRGNLHLDLAQAVDALT